MEILKFFYVKRKFKTFLALKDHLCDDIIIKIIEYNMVDKKLLCNLSNLHKEFKKYQSCEYVIRRMIEPKNNEGPIPHSLLFLNEARSACSKRPNADSPIDGNRRVYLKGKMSEDKEDYYSKHYKTWIKFQYCLNNTLFSFQSRNPYGFQNTKKFSDVLYKD